MMEAEYIALSQACRDLFPIINLVNKLSTTLNLSSTTTLPRLPICIHEDKVGALTLGKLEPRRMTPHSKHYALKYHWFCEHFIPRKIELLKIDTTHQLGDIFTKGLTGTRFW